MWAVAATSISLVTSLTGNIYFLSRRKFNVEILLKIRLQLLCLHISELYELKLIV